MPPSGGAPVVRVRAGRYWPSPLHLHLLRAALLDGAPARSAWEAWRSAVHLDHLDAGSERLLPLLAHNLKRHGVPASELGRYAGILDYTLVTNRRRIARLLPVLRALHDAGIAALLLKGLGLALHHYAHPGLRPMADADLLVPRSRLDDAVGILRARGWQAPGPDPDPAIAHSRLFVAPDGQQLDLHWHALWELSGVEADTALWARAAEGEVSGVPVRVLNPSDMLLHVVVHGARWNSVPPVRWVADAVTVLARAGDRFSWTDLVDEARRQRLVLPLLDGLTYLAEQFAVPVPGDALAALSAHRPSAFERVEHRMRAWTSPALGCFPLELCHHVRVSRSRGPAALFLGWPGYLRRAYGLPSVAALPGAVARRTVRRVRLSRATAD